MPQSGTPLEVLMERYVAGETGAFSALYAAAAPPLRAAVGRWSRDPEQVEDVLQATFLKLHRNKDSYALGQPVLPWLYVIAKRTLFDERRPLRTRLEVLALSESDVAETPKAESSDELEIDMRDALLQLPEQYRDAIALTKLFGFSGSETASLLHTTKAAIKQRVHRGYALLRDLFDGVSTTPMTA